ncbi:MAG TPA: hypothetical protein VHE13_09435 [Opitutus sp.]|nr:hypothetical protein [Opitutus sp.]
MTVRKRFSKTMPDPVPPMEENHPSDSPKGPIQEIDRREFLARVGKAALHAAPVVAYIASSDRVIAMSGAE